MLTTNVFRPHGSVTPVEKTVSGRVKIARSLCIFLMMFVHVQVGIAENVYDRDAGVFDVVYFIFTRLLGLSSVSLLSIVSGYFVVSSLLKAGTLPLIMSKFRTLVVPLVSWNVLTLLLLIVYGMLSGNWRNMPDLTVPGLANGLLALDGWPLDVPLWFLRDLFVCCVFSPVLYLALRRAPVQTIAVLVVYTLFGEGLYLLERPQLMLFFAIGMWLRLAGPDEEEIDRWTRPLAIGLIFMVVVFLALRVERILLGDMEPPLRLALDTMLRLTMAAGFWQFTRQIRNAPVGEMLARFEPYAFFLFCSHAILFNYAAIVFRWFFGNYGSGLFPITFFTLPVLAVVAAVIGLQVASRSPALLFFFNAGHGVERLAPPFFRRQPFRSEALARRKD